LKDGVLIINKPAGMTSHDVARTVKKFFKVRKIGYVGTLDPLATGVLPLLIGEATKLSSFLTKQEKEYIGTIKFGEETDTLDSDGQVVAKGNVESFDTVRAIKVMEAFKGKREQIPPLFSAIKKDGVPLYRLARKGIDVAVKPREVEIKEIEIVEVVPPSLTFRVVCSAGTYIRSLCRDVGRLLGYFGHLSALNRIRSGDFSLPHSIGLKELSAGSADYLSERIIPMGALLKDIPSLEAERNVEEKIRCGIHPRINDFKDVEPHLFQGGSKVRIMSKKGALISIAEMKDKKGETGKPVLHCGEEMRSTTTLTFKLLRVFNE
jgi:tRNA pseudouridine55 synthase